MRRGLRLALSAAALAALLAALGWIFIAWRGGSMAGVYLELVMGVC